MYLNNMRHNPYFNRWFSAIIIACVRTLLLKIVTILILIDGFLQFKIGDDTLIINVKSQSLF